MRWIGRGLRGILAGRLSRQHWFAPVLLLLIVITGLALAPRPTAILPDARPLRGSQPFATLLCAFASAETSHVNGWTTGYYDRLMTGDTDSVDAYWRQVSYGVIDLAGSRAFGWFDLANPASAYARPDLGRADLDALAQDCAATADAAGDAGPDFREYAGINMVFSECVERPRGGAMQLRLDGVWRTYRITWLCPGYASSQQIFAHEIGHSFGLTHSEDEAGSEYGNHWDLMSSAGYCAATTDLGPQAQQPIAYDKDLLGWIAPAAKYVARPAAVATIRLDDLGAGYASAGGFLLAEIPLPGGRFYTVEARSRTGWDVALPAAGVLIHEIDPRRDNRARLIVGEPQMGAAALLSATGGWPVGSAFIDRENDVAVSVDQQVDGGFVVTLYTAPLPWPLPAGERGPGDTVRLAWQAVPGARQYEIRISRVAGAARGSAWGATFVSDRPTLDAALAPGQYRWQVRQLSQGSWTPPQVALVGQGPAWRGVEQVAQLSGRVRVSPLVSAQADGAVEVAWAYDDQQRSVAVTRAAWQGHAWAVEDFLNLSSASRRGMALSFTPAGDLRVTWPAAASGAGSMSSPAVALDAGGRAHAIWAGTGGVRGIFSAILDAHAPSAGPVAAGGAAVRPVRVAGDDPSAPKYSPALALDRAGNAHAVWVDTRDGRSAAYAADQLADGAWGPGRRLSAGDQAVFGQPSIAANARGSVYAAWQGSLDCGGPLPLIQVSFAERSEAGRWQPPTVLAVVSDGAQMIDPVVAANDAGEVFVAWGEVTDGAYRLYAAYRGPSTAWEPPSLVADGYSSGAAIALSLAVTPHGEAYLTWADQPAPGGSIRFAAAR